MANADRVDPLIGKLGNFFQDGNILIWVQAILAGLTRRLQQSRLFIAAQYLRRQAQQRGDNPDRIFRQRGIFSIRSLRSFSRCSLHNSLFLPLIYGLPIEKEKRKTYPLLNNTLSLIIPLLTISVK